MKNTARHTVCSFLSHDFLIVYCKNPQFVVNCKQFIIRGNSMAQNSFYDSEEIDFFDNRVSEVCFTGHRNIPSKVRPELENVLKAFVLSLYERGARVFKAGGAVGFDTMAALAVLDLKAEKKDDSVKLVLCLPAPDQANRYTEYDRIIYNMIKERADSVTYSASHSTTESYYARNRKLVEGSDACVAFCTVQHGGTYYTCRAALLSGVEFINLADFVDFE